MRGPHNYSSPNNGLRANIDGSIGRKGVDMGQHTPLPDVFPESGEDRIARAVLRSATDFAIITTDLNNRVTSWNPGAETLLGWMREEVLGDTLDRIFTPEDRAAGQVGKEEARTRRLGRSEDERWHMRSDGSRFWASGLMMRLEDEETKTPSGYLKILRDRTAQHLAESAAIAREAQFRALVEASPQMTFFADAMGRISYRNPYWYRYTGQQNGLSRGGDWTAAVHPDDREVLLQVWREALATGQACELEVRFWRASDKSWRWFMAKAAPMKDAEGLIEGWIIIGVEIDLMVAARDDLSRNKRALETEVAVRTADRDRMWRLSGDIMMVMGADTRIRSINPAWTRQLGWTESELMGNYFMQRIHPEDVMATQTEIERLQGGKAASRFRCRYQHKEGGYRNLSWTAVLGDGVIHAVARDLTAQTEAAAELEQAQEALRQSQKMEVVGQLTGGIAHDFNNLLTGILGSLEMMQRRAQRGEQVDVARYTNAAMESAKRAAALTHRLLAFSRRQPLDPKPTDANELLNGLSELFRRTLGESIDLNVVTEGGLWTTLCDSHQLENAILNLVINARDAMPQGGILTIQTSNAYLDRAYVARAGAGTPGPYVCIAVSDTGTGMSAEVMAQAFEPFFTTKPQGEGTGLGLSMIYGFARQSNGYAKIESEVDRGTTVKIYLPRFEGEHIVTDVSETAAADMASSSPGKTILVVEDEIIVRKLMVEVLTDMHFHVLEAVDGPTGLRLLESDTRIDLLITDIGLPGLNGRKMVDAARVFRPGLKVLFMTGYAENAALAGGFLKFGMEMITKPFAVTAMISRVTAMIGAS
jgi:PAS domain S-box-containing protein